jgi:serine/threonine-protein kinase
LARFEREARVLASLNHPHIAAIYGVEDSSGMPALVLELVEGETLAERIARAPIPLSEALPIASQIAAALEAAHEHGIIHRDLKPANIKITPDSVVKVLDFGLAKATDAAAAAGGLDPLHSPTVTSPAMLTGLGIILGTAAYMSPEQARGRAADRRSDVWALGCVLYEMLAGGARSGEVTSARRSRRSSRASRTGARFPLRFRRRSDRFSRVVSRTTTATASATSRPRSSS